MSKVTAYHLAKILDKEFSTKSFTKLNNVNDVLEELLDNTENYTAPFSIYDAYVVEKSLPVYNAAALKSGSDLHNVLSDSPDEVALVVDSVLSSINSLHFVAMVSKIEVEHTMKKWLSMSSDYDMVISNFYGSDDYALITKLKTFKK